METSTVNRERVVKVASGWLMLPLVLGLLFGSIALMIYATAAGAVEDGANPNGALNAIAGLSSREGNVIGLMPHPERRIHPLTGGEDGAALLRGLVEAA